VNRLPSLVRQHIAALRALLVFTVLCGIIYPVVMFGVAQAAFHGPANGSMVSHNGQVVGSSLLCQEFTDAKGNPLPQYFQPRPSNAANSASKTDYGCDPGFSGATNLGPNNPTLLKDVQQRRAQVAQFNGVSPSSVPPDAVTASGSGLDPNISPQYAYLQVNRVATARNLSPSVVQALVTSYVQGRTIGFLGEPRVNVLSLNIALDKLSGH
jgi:K+-transporting ATPase ATPase C chain